MAYLLLAERPPSRAHLAQLLFGDANDPLGALRWTLAELRRALDLPLSGDPVRLHIGKEIVVDVHQIATADDGSALQLSGELLEGLHLDANAEFESWLGVARHRVAAAVESRLRQAAVGRLASGAAAEAVTYAARVVADNPLDEANHEQLVRALAMSGDRAAASHQVAVCEDLFRRELGVVPSAALRDAVDVRPAGETPRSHGSTRRTGSPRPMRSGRASWACAG